MVSTLEHVEIIDGRRASRNPSRDANLREKIEQKRASQPNTRTIHFAQTILTPTGDTLFQSCERTELTTTQERIPSRILISPLGRRVIHQNPRFVRQLCNGELPQYRLLEGPTSIQGKFSLVRVTPITLDGEELLLVIKYHDQGDGAYEHERSSGDNEILIDKVSGIDNFLALRAIGLYAEGLKTPEPIMATQRLFVATFVNGEPIEPTILKKQDWIEQAIRDALGRAYAQRWLKPYPYRLLGLPLRRRFDIDPYTNGNILQKDGNLYIIDPIYNRY